MWTQQLELRQATYGACPRPAEVCETLAAQRVRFALTKQVRSKFQGRARPYTLKAL